MPKSRSVRVLISSLMFAFLLVPVPNSGAADLDLPHRFALGVRQAHVSYSEENLTVNDIEFDTEPYSSIMTELSVSYFFNSYLSVELGLDHVKTSADLNALDLSDDTGELRQIPILLSGRFSLPVGEVIVPYIGGGLGYFFNEVDQTGVDVDNSIGYFAGGGADIFLMRNIALNVDVKYILNQIKVSFSEDYDENFDLNMLVVGGGVKYYF